MLVVEAVPPLVLIFGILGSLLAGIATATEASAIGAGLALLIVIIRGRFAWRTFYSAMLETGRTSAMILFIVVGATAFTGVFNITGGLRATQEIIRGLDMEPWMLITMMMFIVFILGAFLDWTGIVLLSFPIFLPIVQEMEGVSLLWFVVLMAVVLQTSFLTPPFGYALFYLRAIAPKEVRTGHIIRGVLPFIGLIVVMCVLVAAVPAAGEWLPSALYGNDANHKGRVSMTKLDQSWPLRPAPRSPGRRMAQESWTMTTTWPSSLELIETDKHFVDLANKLTEGELTIEFFEGGSLVPAGEVFGAVRIRHRAGRRRLAGLLGGPRRGLLAAGDHAVAVQRGRLRQLDPAMGRRRAL